MNDLFRSKFHPTQRRDDPPPTPDNDTSAVESTPCYSLIAAGGRQRLMLEFRFKTGNALALAYSYLVAVRLDPSRAIILDFSGEEVTLSGHHLGPLFAALVAQRVTMIRETDDLEAAAMLPADATVVTTMTVTPRA